MSTESPQQLTRDDLEEMLHSKVESFTCSPLTAPGENFGSILLKVDATLLPDHRKVAIAAKLVVMKNLMGTVPPFRDFMRKELDMYLRVRPEIQAIQEEYKVPEEMFLDVLARCYGARTARGGGVSQPVDETAVILMENLQASGYHLVDRIVGMDLKHAESVVTHLARFQAMFVVFKLKKPDFFKDTVMATAAAVKRGTPPKAMMSDRDKEAERKLSTVLCVPSAVEYADRIKAVFRKGMFPMMERSTDTIEPFATVAHNDFWSNNVLFAYGGSNKENITGVKLIDFQMTSYGSPVSDLIFFLYSSTSLDVTKDDRDRLIQLYYHEFIKWLELFGCDTKPFSHEAFMKELEVAAPMQFNPAFTMLRVSCMSRSNPPDINNPEAFLKMRTDNTGLDEIYFKKIDRIIQEFVEKNWI